MRPGILAQVLAYAALVSSETVYITNLPLYKALAPCASNAVSYIVQGLATDKCPTLVTPLAACACTQDQNSASINAKISSQVLGGCGKTAIADVTSASVVFSAYCNQITSYAAPTPTAGAVSKYITDISQFSDLAPCAGSALNYAINYLTISACPTGASALQSCVCTKDQLSLAISDAITSSVVGRCGAGHPADITSAQAIFRGYCGLGQGSSVFPTPSMLAGNINYYITALPMYSALAKCAQTAVSYAVQQATALDCPSGPRPLVSCICAKDQNLDRASSQIKTSISAYCDSTATAHLSSALEVLNYYCSAGNGLLSATGVTATATVTVAGGAKTTSALKGATATGAGATDTSIPEILTGAETSSTNPGTVSKVPVAAIAGGVGGAVIFVIIMTVVGCWYRRRHQRPKPPPDPVVDLKKSRSPLAELPQGKPGWGKRTELPGPPHIPNPNVFEAPGNSQRRHEAFGSTHHPVEIGPNSGRGNPLYEMHVP